MSKELGKPYPYTNGSDEEQHREFLKKLDEIIAKTFLGGQLIIVATKQHGKTNASMWLLRKVLQSQYHTEGKVKTLIFDTVLNFRFKFDTIPYIDINKVSYKPAIQDLLVDLPFTDTQLVRKTITEILMEDFIKKRTLKEEFEGENPYKNLYLVEEMQNVWGSYGMAGSHGRFALKIFSECANYGMVIWGITQRLADVSTKVIERSEYYLIGKLSGDNDIKKIARVTKKNIAEKIKSLKRGELLFWDKENPEYIDLIYFPKFKDAKDKGYVKRIFLGD